MLQDQKVNRVARKIGTTLCMAGEKMIKSAFRVEDNTEITKADLKTALNEYGFTGQSLYDRKYFLVDWETWKQIIEIDWTETKKYVADRRDCDNFAFLFAAHASSIFGLNSAGTASGVMKAGNKTVRHLFTIIAVDSPYGIRFYALEPQTDKWTVIVKGQPIVVGPRGYTIDWVNFF